ncbi:MAG: MraY family glycosyltransferase [Myxococcota bacterium]
MLFALTLLLATGIALYVAPLLIHAAERYGILDHGDGKLKEQHKPVAYLGGLVVFIAMLVALSVTQEFDARLMALLLGASLVVSVGLVDDLGTLVPKDKLLGQILAALVLVKGGITIHLDAVPWYVADVATVFWIVSVTNAFNILDVSDGLCAGVGAVAGLVLGLWCLHTGLTAEAFLCAALCGGLVGFLRHNWRPARMYLGDTGSMLVGITLAAVTVMSQYSQQNPVAPLITPLAILAVPLFDMTFVVVCRMHLGLRIYHGSPDHFAVRLRRHGVSPARIAAGAMVITALCSLGGVAAARADVRIALAVGIMGMAFSLLAGMLLWRVDPRKVPAPVPADRTQTAAEPRGERELVG